MNKEEYDLFLERLQSLQGKWLCKKSRNPFGDKNKPAFFNNKISNDRRRLRLFIRNGKAFKMFGKNVDNLEVITKQEAQELNKLFFDSGFLSECKEPTEFVCIRKDTGEQKKAFTVDNFQGALYRLKLKNPNHECNAYVCPVCKNVHLGKNPR